MSTDLVRKLCDAAIAWQAAEHEAKRLWKMTAAEYDRELHEAYGNASREAKWQRAEVLRIAADLAAMQDLA